MHGWVGSTHVLVCTHVVLFSGWYSAMECYGSIPALEEAEAALQVS